MTSVLDLMSEKGIGAAAELSVAFCKRHAKMRGDYLEFGTFRGESFTAFFRGAQKYQLDDMRFFGFDSFEGLPETSTCPPAAPGGDLTAFRAGNYACSEAELRNILTNNGVDMTKVELIPGFYDQSLSEDLKTELSLATAGIVNIDCDLYESTLDVLAFVTGLLRSGSVLLFDDWLAFDGHPMRGEIRACNEWLAANPQIHLTEYFKYRRTGMAFIVSMLNEREQRVIDRERASQRPDAF